MRSRHEKERLQKFPFDLPGYNAPLNSLTHEEVVIGHVKGHLKLGQNWNSTRILGLLLQHKYRTSNDITRLGEAAKQWPNSVTVVVFPCETTIMSLTCFVPQLKILR